MRITSKFSVAVVMIISAMHSKALAQSDSTGIRIPEVPANLPSNQRIPLLKQRALLETAVDSINAAGTRFNSRCGYIAPGDGAKLAACQQELSELNAGAAQLNDLKAKFKNALDQAIAAVAATGIATASVVAPAVSPRTASAERVATSGAPAVKENPAQIEAEATAEIHTSKDDPCGGSKGGGSAMDQLRGAAAAGNAAATSGDKGKAMDVMDRCGKKGAGGGEAIHIGERKPLVVPEQLKTNSDFQALAKQEQMLAAEHAKLKTELDAARSKKDAGKGDSKALADAVYQAQKKMSENEQAQANTRFKEEEMIRNVNRGVNFGGKSNKTPPPAPATGTKRNTP